MAALGVRLAGSRWSRAVARSRAYGDASVVALGALVAQSFGVIPVVFGALTDRPGRDTSKGQLQGALHVTVRAAQGCEIPNFKGSYLGRFPLVSADFWTSDHLSEWSRRVGAFPGTRARGKLTLKRR